MKAIEKGMYPDAYGTTCRVKVGSRPNQRVAQTRFPHGTDRDVMRTWLLRAEADLRDHPDPVRGTLGGDAVVYLRDAKISKACREQRTQQLAWWCAQSVDGPVLPPKQARAEAEARTRGEEVPKRRTLGDLARHKLPPARLRTCLEDAFAPDDPEVDPTQYASTSNSYRTALFHLFTTLDQDLKNAPRNPLENVQVRPQPGAQLSGQDARIVREILRHVPSAMGPSSRISELRLECLAWIHITPDQLKKVDPARDFHDVPDATREDIIAGAITLTKRPRLKGKKGKKIPMPETIPLNPYGVAAMRAFAAEPAAWSPKIPGSTAKGKKDISNSSLNKIVKRACARAQEALAMRDVVVDLSGFTLYHLKHSLATTASLASHGLVDRRGAIAQAPGLQKALDHAASKMTSIYTQAAVAPTVRAVNTATALYLEHLFTVPLNAPAALKLVAK